MCSAVAGRTSSERKLVSGQALRLAVVLFEKGQVKVPGFLDLGFAEGNKVEANDLEQNGIEDAT